MRYCLTVNLKNDPLLITRYIELHKEVWPEVKASIYDSGILHMEIYHSDSRLFMIIETMDDFTFEAKAKLDMQNPKVQEWEKLMGTFQEPFPDAKPGEKWRVMDKIFDLPKQG